MSFVEHFFPSGMCGTYDGVTGNDFLTPQGVVLGSGTINQWGASWVVSEATNAFVRINGVKKGDTCEADPPIIVDPIRCPGLGGMSITAPGGALEICQDAFAPYVACDPRVTDFVNTCAFDVCSTGELTTVLDNLLFGVELCPEPVEIICVFDRDCNVGGQCVANTCVCGPGFTGTYCTRCPTGYWGDSCTTECVGGAASPCSGHGTCNNIDGACECLSGWWGSECQSECQLSASDPCSGNGACDDGANGNGTYVQFPSWLACRPCSRHHYQRPIRVDHSL
jgi:hypothetical protein